MVSMVILPPPPPRAGRPGGQGMKEVGLLQPVIRKATADPSKRAQILVAVVQNASFVPLRIEIEPVMVLNCRRSDTSEKPASIINGISTPSALGCVSA